MNALIPVEGEGVATENGGEETCSETAGNDNLCQYQDISEPSHNAKQAVVEQDQGGIGGHGCAEIHYENSHKRLRKQVSLHKLYFAVCWIGRNVFALLGKVSSALLSPRVLPQSLHVGWV